MERRRRSRALVVSWALVGFRGLGDYPDLSGGRDRMDERGYTVYALGVDLGLSPSVAWVLWGGSRSRS